MIKKKILCDYPEIKKKILAKKNKTISRMSFSLSKNKCIFCEKCPQSKDFLAMINKALYVKFSASQNYYYSKDINEILSETRNKIAIKFKDQSTYDENEENLKRFYSINEIEGKITILTEYYKFHKDVPRMFMLSISKIINNYHDKHRKIEYVRITKIIKQNNEKKNKKEKNLNEGYIDEKQDKNPLPNKTLKNNFLKILDDVILNEEENEKENSKDYSDSRTIIELQKKLGEIINEKSKNELEFDKFSNGQSFSNIFDNSSFVKFMKNLEVNQSKNSECKKICFKKQAILNIDKTNNEKENTKPNVKQNKTKSANFKNINKKEKETNISFKNISSPIQEKFGIEIKSSLLPIQKPQKIVRKVSSNRKSEDMNYLKFDKPSPVINNKKNVYNPKTIQSKTEISNDYIKFDCKTSHLRILSNVESSTPKMSNNINYYSKIRLIKKASTNTNSINQLISPLNKKKEEKKIVIKTNNFETNNFQLNSIKSTKIEGNNKLNIIGSPKSNKELKYFYKTKHLMSSRNSKNLSACLVTPKNTLDVKSYEEFQKNNLITPKMNEHLNRESLHFVLFLFI